jgi:hypothetical protein
MGFFVCKPHGMLECWNTGYKKRKTKSFFNNVESTLFDDARQTSIFCLYPKSTPSKLNHQCKNMRVDFFFKPIIPFFQHSIIPIVSEAN